MEMFSSHFNDTSWISLSEIPYNLVKCNLTLQVEEKCCLYYRPLDLPWEDQTRNLMKAREMLSRLRDWVSGSASTLKEFSFQRDISMKWRIFDGIVILNEILMICFEHMKELWRNFEGNKQMTQYLKFLIKNRWKRQKRYQEFINSYFPTNPTSIKRY